MNQIKIAKSSDIEERVIFKKIQFIKENYHQIIINSDRILLQNLIEESKIILGKIDDDSISYREKAKQLDNLADCWHDLWKHYNHIPEAIELGFIIDDLTNYFLGYQKLCIGISYINECKVDDEKEDFKNTVLGHQFISEAIDVFIEVFSNRDLEQLRSHATKTLSLTYPNLKEYFENSIKKSNLITELRGYCSLIILRVDEYLRNVQSPVKNSNLDNSVSWWENVDGVFADDSIYDEAMSLGREYRNSQ